MDSSGSERLSPTNRDFAVVADESILRRCLIVAIAAEVRPEMNLLWGQSGDRSIQSVEELSGRG
jgi:hypothetical protein